MILRKYSIAFLAGLAFATAAIAQNYSVTIETLVGGKSEDRIVFNMSVGESQKKGFDGKLLAKRYRAEGFPNKILDLRAAEENAEKEDAKQKNMRLLEKARATLDALKSAKTQAEYSIENAQMKIEDYAGRLSVLEKIVEKGEKNAPDFAKLFGVYCDKYEEKKSDADIEYKKLARRRPRNTGDVDEIDVGSYCEITVSKGNNKAVSVDFDYAYSRQLSFFYSDDNNNGNAVNRQPIFERFEKYGVKNLVLKLGETYCYQFGRLKPEEARNLQDALNSTALMGGMGKEAADAEIALPEIPQNEMDDAGTLAEIRKKHPSASKAVRVLISVKKAR